MDISRIDQLKQWISTQEFDALFVDDPVDLFYLTGLHFSLGKMVVSAKGACLFVDGRYIESARKCVCCEIQLPSAIKKWIEPYKKISFDSAFVTFADYQGMKKKFEDKEWIAILKPLKKLRMIKDEGEIRALKKAAKLTRDGCQYIISLLKEGVSEEALSLEFEWFCRKRGASKLSFEPIVAFGENSAYPHHRAGKTLLQKNQIVLIDVGVVVDSYAGDMTRVTFFGTPPIQLEKDYELIQMVQKKVISHIAPGVRFGDLDKLARQELEKHGCANLFTHGLSHGIGLDVHEYPKLRLGEGDEDLLLEPGMTFTVEPGIYRIGVGGVRYEDVILVTKTGHETL